MSLIPTAAVHLTSKPLTVLFVDCWRASGCSARLPHRSDCPKPVDYHFPKNLYWAGSHFLTYYSSGQVPQCPSDVCWWCERCLLITESPKTPGHYRYLIWVLEAFVCLFVCLLEWNQENYTPPPMLDFSFFLSWVSKTQPNHWTKRMQDADDPLGLLGDSLQIRRPKEAAQLAGTGNDEDNSPDSTQKVRERVREHTHQSVRPDTTDARCAVQIPETLSCTCALEKDIHLVPLVIWYLFWYQHWLTFFIVFVYICINDTILYL